LVITGGRWLAFAGAARALIVPTVGVAGWGAEVEAVGDGGAWVPEGRGSIDPDSVLDEVCRRQRAKLNEFRSSPGRHGAS
jgi:hypothetical protein